MDSHVVLVGGRGNHGVRPLVNIFVSVRPGLAKVQALGDLHRNDAFQDGPPGIRPKRDLDCRVEERSRQQRI